MAPRTLPAVVSTVVLSIVWTWIYQPFSGILNYVTSLAKIAPNNWLGNPHTAMAAIIVMTVVSGIGTPVIFITASDNPVLRERAKKVGAVGFLKKPFDATSLADAIESALSPGDNWRPSIAV